MARPIIRPEVVVTVTYKPTEGRVSIATASDDPDMVIVALAKAQATIIQAVLGMVGAVAPP